MLIKLQATLCGGKQIKNQVLLELGFLLLRWYSD